MHTPNPVESTLGWDLLRGFARQGLGWRKRTAARRTFVTKRVGEACAVMKRSRPIFTFLTFSNPSKNLSHGDHTELLKDTTVTRRKASLSSRPQSTLWLRGLTIDISDIRNTYRHYHHFPPLLLVLRPWCLIISMTHPSLSFHGFIDIKILAYVAHRKMLRASR